MSVHKAMTVFQSALAHGHSIDDIDSLRVGAIGALLGHAVLAPSTLGSFLLSFPFGHARQLYLFHLLAVRANLSNLYLPLLLLYLLSTSTLLSMRPTTYRNKATPSSPTPIALLSPSVLFDHLHHLLLPLPSALLQLQLLSLLYLFHHLYFQPIPLHLLHLTSYPALLLLFLLLLLFHHLPQNLFAFLYHLQVKQNSTQHYRRVPQ